MIEGHLSRPHIAVKQAGYEYRKNKKTGKSPLDILFVFNDSWLFAEFVFSIRFVSR